MFPNNRPYRATFLSLDDGFDAIGNATQERTKLGTAWVGIRPLSTRWRAYMEASGKYANVTHEVTLARPSFSIPMTSHMVVGGRTYVVEAMLDAPNDSEVVLMVSEQVD